MFSPVFLPGKYHEHRWAIVCGVAKESDMINPKITTKLVSLVLITL